MNVYKKVRAYMDDNGFKQNAIAHKVNIPVATFNAILNGKRTMHAEDLKAICCALKVSPEIFIEFKDDDTG